MKLSRTTSAEGCSKWSLLARGNDRIFVVSAPWYVGMRL
jgi:hypothetical protein